MAKITSRRWSVLENPEEVLNLARQWLEAVKRQWKWLVLGAAVLVVALTAWGVSGRMQAAREDRAATALVQLGAKFPAGTADVQAAKALQELIGKYPGTKAAGEAELKRANLLYKMKNYPEAAKSYETLLQKGDPGWNTLISESLSYCYEGMGDFKKAAAGLRPVVEESTGNLHTETMQRLALLYDKAGEPKEAAVYWRKLLEMKPNPGLVAYLEGKVTAAEAKTGGEKK